MHPQRDLAGARRKRRDVAGELDAVAEALLGLNIDVFAGEAFALPGLFRKARALAFGRAQPPLIFFPALGEIAAHEQKNAEPGMGVGVARARARWRAATRTSPSSYSPPWCSVVPRLAQPSANSA